MGLRLEVKLEGVPDEHLATLQALTTNIHGSLRTSPSIWGSRASTSRS